MKAKSGEIAAESPDVRRQIRPSSDERNEDQVATTEDKRNNEVPRRSVSSAKSLNDEHNQEHDTMITKRTKDGQSQKNIQGDQDSNALQVQAAQYTNAYGAAGASKEKHLDKGEKAVWKVKENITTKGNANKPSKDNEREQPNNNKDKAGKLVKFASNKHDHFPSLHNNPRNSQNELGKGHVNMQADVNEAYGQIEQTDGTGHNSEIKAPPPLKISSNFDMYRHSQQITTQNSPKHNQNKTPGNFSFTKSTNTQIPNPSPPTVTQSLATRLKANQIKNAIPMDIIPPIISTKQGYPSITFHENDFMQKMSGRCKYTLVGKFTNAMPKMEIIRKSFIAQTDLTGGVKIAHFNSRHIYIDLDNEADHISVWTKQRMYIAGHVMRLQVWTPTFKPAEETPIVPIWITLSELPWHCYYMDILTPLLSPVGKALYLDSATMQKTRGSVAKVRVQIDITKERPQHVWMGFSEKDPSLGKWQIIEFEDVPSYCLHCKHQGHIIGECPLKERDEEFKKRKEGEVTKTGQEKQQNHNPSSSQQQEGNKGKSQSNKSNNAKGSNEESTTHKEEQWQTQTRKKNKNQQSNQDQGMNQNSQSQVPKTRSSQEQQGQIPGMTAESPVIVFEESGEQTLTPPSPVVDVSEHYVNCESPVPVTPPVYLLVMKLLEGGWL
ncbi:hypothetical protein RDI58_000911 [Solanum bulbocastanum]|uniref:DUF4283 domain-containing protein n=1 Tax=Solanum bulbocastanum TaxID=147425 RepID=A0AAN8UD09_SOLBU